MTRWVGSEAGFNPQFTLEPVTGPYDGQTYIARCLHEDCDWRSARTMDPDSPFRKYGPATQHWRDKHGNTDT